MSARERISVRRDGASDFDIVFRSEPAFGPLAMELASLGFQGHRLMIVTDDTVGQLYADTLAKALSGLSDHILVSVLPDGEQYKTPQQILPFYDRLEKAGFERGDLIVALGGGTVCDFAGFLSATWHCGLDYIRVPTTLPAITDVARKARVCLHFGRAHNAVGVLHDPVLVYINLSVLASLPERDFIAGTSGILCRGLAHDSAFFDTLFVHSGEIQSRDSRILHPLLLHCLEIDAEKHGLAKEPPADGTPHSRSEAVDAEPVFGDPVTQVLETAAPDMLHGECLAVACVALAFLSMKRRLITFETFTHTERVFERYGLPVRANISGSPGEVLSFWQKSAGHGTLPSGWLLLKSLGTSFCDTNVTEYAILDALAHVIQNEG